MSDLQSDDERPEPISTSTKGPFLGIRANTIVFTVINRLVLNPLPLSHPNATRVRHAKPRAWLRLRNYDRIMRPTIFMRRCLELAEVAARGGDTAVGSVIVCGDEIVGEGVERIRAARDPSAHAEVEAIRQACQHLDTLDLSACTLYSTVEPCVLCGYAIRRTGIAHVLYGVAAGQAGACTSAYAILADRDLEGWPQPPEVTGGVLAEECLAALRRTREPGQRS
jgi:tRNA(adenine34) deaminase